MKKKEIKMKMNTRKMKRKIRMKIIKKGIIQIIDNNNQNSKTFLDNL